MIITLLNSAKLAVDFTQEEGEVIDYLLENSDGIAAVRQFLNLMIENKRAQMQEHIRIVSYKTLVENADINEAMALANPELANAIRAVKEV